MAILSIVGPKGGIGKTTLSINTTAALTRALGKPRQEDRICLVDLDLRLPTISSLLDSHPAKTFYDLFETLANKTYQVDFLRTLYQVTTWFQAYLDGDVEGGNRKLHHALGMYKTLNDRLYQYSNTPMDGAVHEMIMTRNQIHGPAQIKNLEAALRKIDLPALRDRLKKADADSRPCLEEYLNYIEEYGFTIMGGEVPVLGKRGHRKRINEPEFLLLFLEFLVEVFRKFQYVVLDTPAGGINHMSSLMNEIDQVLFVFDLSNTIAINGSIDALHSFIDYYEDFQADFMAGRLTGLDRVFVNRLVAETGRNTLLQSLKAKKFGILFNRFQNPSEITKALRMLREYLDTLDKYHRYKKRIHIVGMVPNHKIINITNNSGSLFYDMEMDLTQRMDQVANAVISEYKLCPSLQDDDKVILRYLTRKKPPLVNKLTRIAGNFS